MKVWLFLRVGYPKRIPGAYLLAMRDNQLIVSAAFAVLALTVFRLGLRRYESGNLVTLRG